MGLICRWNAAAEEAETAVHEKEESPEVPRHAGLVGMRCAGAVMTQALKRCAVLVAFSPQLSPKNAAIRINLTSSSSVGGGAG